MLPLPPWRENKQTRSSSSAAVHQAHRADMALEHRFPAASSTRAFVDAGGLMSYGADGPALFRHGAKFVQRVLQGRQPGDLPIEQPTKFELVINLQDREAPSASAVPAVFSRADTVLE